VDDSEKVAVIGCLGQPEGDRFGFGSILVSVLFKVDPDGVSPEKQALDLLDYILLSDESLRTLSSIRFELWADVVELLGAVFVPQAAQDVRTVLGQ
jgi:hypothetical protein